VRVVLDTNVFVSGVFFGGIPGRLLELWRDGSLDLLLTTDILVEYQEVLSRLQDKYPGVDPSPALHLAVRRGTFVQPAVLGEPVCEDPDDDMFLAAALGGAARVVISGDAHLRAVSGYRQVEVLTPAQFIKRLGSTKPAGVLPRPPLG